MPGPDPVRPGRLIPLGERGPSSAACRLGVPKLVPPVSVEFFRFGIHTDHDESARAASNDSAAHT